MRALLLLALLVAGCAEVPPAAARSGAEAGFTPRQWQARADQECIDLLAAGVVREWESPMIVIDRHGFHKQKRIDIIKRPGSACVFAWATRTCICETPVPIEHIEFSACYNYEQKGEL